MAQLVNNLQETPVRFLGREDLLEKGQATHSNNLEFPCGSVGKESTCSAEDLGWEDPLEKEKATHSSILACRMLYSPQGHKESDTTK